MKWMIMLWHKEKKKVFSHRTAKNRFDYVGELFFVCEEIVKCGLAEKFELLVMNTQRALPAIPSETIKEIGELINEQEGGLGSNPSEVIVNA